MRYVVANVYSKDHSNIQRQTYTNHLLVESVQTPNGPANGRSVRWAALNLRLLKTGWLWRTNSSRRCMDKNPCRLTA